MIERIDLAEDADDVLLLTFVAQVDSAKADEILASFANTAMRERLKKQRGKGFYGWHTPQCENSDLKARLLENAESGDWVDVMNLAAMLAARESMFKEVMRAPKAG